MIVRKNMSRRNKIARSVSQRVSSMRMATNNFSEWKSHTKAALKMPKHKCEDKDKMHGGPITAHACNNMLSLELKDEASHLLKLQSILKKLSDLTGVQFYYFHGSSIIDITTCSSSEVKKMANLGIFRNSADPPETLSSSIIVTCCLEKLLEELDKSFEQQPTFDNFKKGLLNLKLSLKTVNDDWVEHNIKMLELACSQLTSHIKIKKMTLIIVKKKDFACEILCLDQIISDLLYTNDEEELQHQPLDYFIDMIMKQRWQTFLDECQESGECSSLDSQLILLGFKPNCAKLLAGLLKDNLSNAESAYYWANQYLNDLRLNHPLFNAKIYKPLSTSYLLLKIYDCDPPSVQHIQETFHENGFKFLFHAASEDDLYSIVSNGIRLCRGGVCKDFSHNKGFYLFDSFEAAFRWSQLKNIYSKSFVISFKIDIKKLDCHQANGLDVTSDINKWKKIVKYFRSGAWTIPIDSTLKNEINQSVFIRGPMLVNFKEFIMERKEPQFFTIRDDIVTQICVRNETFAQELNSSIFAIISTGNGTCV